MGERVDRTNAERKRRYRARLRAEKEVVERHGYALSTPAVAAAVEARAVLGADADRFAAAVRRYVLAVDAAESARCQWVELDRPVRDTFANGMAGVHPALKAWEQLEAQAARFADALGLTPASAKRISGVGRAGRSMGAASAADRKALPGILHAEPGRLRLASSDAAVDRARGHAED